MKPDIKQIGIGSAAILIIFGLGFKAWKDEQPSETPAILGQQMLVQTKVKEIFNDFYQWEDPQMIIKHLHPDDVKNYKPATITKWWDGNLKILGKFKNLGVPVALEQGKADFHGKQLEKFEVRIVTDFENREELTIVECWLEDQTVYLDRFSVTVSQDEYQKLNQ